ncbi:unnamed protein product [Commensalibacter communis]|uniref:tetratricopeptide repeat protein n=1 Tax=Commensalibacter communis TaxID=2972786 RepID=UPI0022FF5DDA|nr:tetratricopeptide repeat protein [Commensalibacter communis]CAI3954440.1 unnamed protein product [Commensalibacter communis]CAI3958442.1 unnamed protein product [Commensalibacter communis]
MKLIKCSLLLIVGLSLFIPKVFADNLDNVPLATLKQRMNHGDTDAETKYYTITGKKYKNKSLTQLEEMANQGDGDAAAQLASKYEFGMDGASKDPEKALEWYKKSVNLGFEESLMNVANFYLDGKVVPQDVNKAIKLYEQVANKGSLRAYNFLGVLYSQNKYGIEDFFKSKEWFEKAANLGSGFALFNLGSYYENGIGTLQDKEKAKEYYKQACLKKEQAGCSGYKRLNN